MKTVIYITNNILDEKIFKLCQKNILESIGDYHLISVSQEPMDFGENICVGKLPNSSLSIDIQMMEALKKIKTEYIAIAEHDCLYTPEHFEFTPPDDKFYYNKNVWLLQTYSDRIPQANGTFSFFPKRIANSQLICRTDMMIKATQDRIDMMSDPVWLKKYPTGRIGEVGLMTRKHIDKLAKWGSVAHIKEKLIKYINDYSGVNFKTKNPNIDIRHKDNLTKNRRGYKRRFKIPYWGTMKDIYERT